MARKRPKMVCLSEDEYKELVRARGKYEYETGEKTSGFGDFIKFVAGLYIAGKVIESLGEPKQSK